MSGSKHFDKIAWSVTAFILIITILLMNGSALGLEAQARNMGYENRLFDNTKVHSIDIVMDDWDEFIAGAQSEEYYTAAVVIDGEAYKNVAIRGKGNTSLSTVSSMNSDRYSFKIEFDHYDSSLTYHGLDKLSLNNLIQDSTMIKDYLTYTMMNEFGAAAPLCSFVYITVNGEDWGLYLAVEGVEDSFLERNYGSDYGELYKPDSMSFGGGRGNGKDFNMEDFMNNENSSANSAQNFVMPNMGNFTPSAMFGGNMPDMGNFGQAQGGMGGGMGMGSSDVKLQYIDDNVSSYSNIWNNAKTDITEADKTRLIKSLKTLSTFENIESAVDVESVIRYFVVHNYVCNGDSYTGSMIHNYYLYEEDGKMAMIPWDYNLAFGTFQGGNGQSTVNTPIDSPVSGSAGSDRPMWYWILSDESYTELYHRYFEEFLNSVDIQSIIDNAYNLINSYVEKDPTAFYTYEEFEKGIETIKKFCSLRSESIYMQLSEGNTVNSTNYADASDLTLSDMGSMGGGMGSGNRGDFDGEMPDMGNFDPSQIQGGFGGGFIPQSSDESSAGGTLPLSAVMPQNPQNGDNGGDFAPPMAGATAEAPDSSGGQQMPGGFGGQMPGNFSGQMPDTENFDPSQIPGGFGGQMPGQQNGTEESQQPENQNGSENAQLPGSGSNNNRPSGNNMGMQNDNFGGANTSSPSADSGTVLLIVSVLVLALGLIIAKFYKV
ncbi:MAG: spore coat protein CotH [Ruminococcaceae bacterium]|nr:spore coat protein CotH [Oscillospiraceae bacterium]